ncbi:hypothetical protein QOT17_001526 [Balamuthia mandrillaris]
MTTYCPRCKRKTADSGKPIVKVAANGRRYQLTKCGSCGARKSKFLSEGEGLVDNYNAVKTTLRQMFGLRLNAPPATRRLVEPKGNTVITSMYVVRSPIQQAITTLGNILTLGDLSRMQRKLNYDNLYHLYLVLRLQTGEVIRLEKNQVVSARLASEADLHPHNGGAMQVNVRGRPTLAAMLTRTLKAVGERRMWLYSATRYNCQLFIHDILAANGMLTAELKNFIIQDAGQLLKGHPRIRGLAKLATDLAAKIDYVFRAKMTEIIDQVRELCRQNLCNNEICEKLNLTVWQLKTIMFSNHIQKPHKKKHVFDEAGSKQAYILNALGVKPSVIL